jgi:carbonic anhydrase/acetyltransferase-like protein (isoleucine patch superfamily)
MVQGKFVIIKDLAVIMPGTVLPEGTVVPSFSIWAGNPGKSHPICVDDSCRVTAPAVGCSD